MPSTIESRIVSMVFDNKQFEKNVATSQDTLKELNKSLEFKDADKNFKGLEDASSKVTFSQMRSSIGDIAVKLKASSVIGMEVLKSLTNSAINFAKTWASKVIDPIVNGGWNRATAIDQATFKLQGLGIAWKEIEDDINYGVKDTAYGLGDAATAAAQFAASGVQIGNEMKTALRSISGVAAMTSSSYSDIAGIFTGIAGANRVYADDLNSLAARGLNAAAVLAEALGTTEENVRDMVSAGKIDFATFAKAMDDAFGEHAKKGNETFEGSLDNMKSALGRIGAEFASSFRANMIPVWNALRVTFNDVKARMGPIFETADAIMTDLSERVTAFIEKIDNLVVKGGAFKRIFDGVADIMEAVYEIVITIADTIADAFALAIPQMSKIDSLLFSAEEFADNFKADHFIQAVRPFAEMAKSFKEMVQSEDFIVKLVTGVRTLVDIFMTIYSLVHNILFNVKTVVKTFIEGFNIGSSDNVKALFSIQGLLNVISNLLKKINEFQFSIGFQVFATRFNEIVKIVGEGVGVLLSSLQTFGSAFSTAWRNIFPKNTFDQFQGLFNKTFRKITEAIREGISSFSSADGVWTKQVKIFEKLFKIVDAGKKVFSVIAQAIGVVIANVLRLAAVAREAFYEIFDGSHASAMATQINRLVIFLQAFVNKLLFSETAVENFKRGFKGLFAVASIVKDIFEAVFGVFAKVFQQILPDMTRNTEGAINGISGFVGRIGDMLVRLKEWLDQTDAIDKAADFIFRVIVKILNVIRDIPGFIERAKEAFDAFVTKVTGSSLSEHFDNLKEKVKGAWESIKNFFKGTTDDVNISDVERKISPMQTLFENLKKVFGGLVSFLQKAWPIVQTVFGAVIEIVTTLFGKVGDVLSSIGSNFQDGGLATMLLGAGSLAGGIGGATTGLKGLVDSVTGPIEGLKTALGDFQNNLDSGKLTKIAISIGLIAAAVIAMALIDPIGLGIAVGAMYTLMEMLQDFMTRFYALADAMGKSGLKEFRKLATGLLILAPALFIIAEAVKVMGKMETMDLIKGVVALYAMLEILGNFAERMSKLEKSIVSASASMLLMAVALAVMVIPMKAFGHMEWEEIVKGLAAVGALLLEFAITTKLIQGGGALSAAATVVILAAAMNLMIAPMMFFAHLEWEEIGKGLATIGALLLEFVIATKLMTGGGALVAAATVTTLAFAMILLIAPMEAFAHMEWEEIAKGLVAVGALILEFAIACKLLQGSGAPLAAASLILLATALTIMIAPMEAFGHMEWSEIGKGLLVIAGALAAFVVAGYLAAPVALAIVALAAALLLLGAAVALAGAGILQMGLGLTMMTGMGPEIGETVKAVLTAILSVIPQFVATIMEAIKVLVTGILGIIETLIVGIFTMFPQIVSGVLNLLGNIISAVVEFIPTLIQYFPTIAEAFFFMLKTIVQKFAEVAPELFDALGIILRHFLQMLNDVAPDFWAFVATTLLGIIQVIRDTSPALIETIFEIVLKILEELAKNMADIVNLLIDTLITLMETLTTRLPELSLAVVDFIIGLINSVANTIMEKAPEIRDAIANLIGSIIKMVLELFGIDTSNMENNKFQEIGKFLLGGFIGGIVDKFPEFWNKIKEFFKKIGEWFKGKFEEFKGFGKRILEGLRDGVKEKFETVKEKITGFFDKIGGAVKKLFGINSPSTYFKDVGKYIMQGFQNGADQEHTGVMDKVKGFFGKIGQGVKDLFGIDKEDGMFTGIGKKIMSAFKSAVSDSSGDTESEVTGVFSKVTESAAGAEEQFSSVGQRLIAGLNKGMASVANTAINTFNEILNMTKNSADGYYGQFYQIGVQMVNGLANGMRANKPIANRSSQEMANELATIARQTLGIRSPSRVFAEIGKYVDEGMAKGISQYSGLIAVAGVDVADTAVDTVSQAIAMVGNMVEDVSGDPVIRPVLDLTEIENGTQRIANMFEDPTYSAMNPFFMGGGYIDHTVAPIKMGTGSGVNTTSNTTNNNAAININVNAARGQNAEEIADAVQKRLKLSLDQRGYAFR